MQVLGCHENLLFVVWVVVRGWIVHGGVDAISSVLVHLILPINTHLLHFSICLHIDHCLNALILHLLDLRLFQWVWSQENIQVADLGNHEISMEESIMLVNHSI
jgi:hypothetical protein